MDAFSFASAERKFPLARSLEELISMAIKKDSVAPSLAQKQTTIRQNNILVISLADTLSYLDIFKRVCYW